MNEPKPFASLSPSLLARKGHARPAMRPQAYNSLDDLGWNDMGPDLPAMPAVLRQHEEIAAEFAAQEEPPAAREPADAIAPTSRALGGGKAAFTLRLNADRHLRLRIACALRHRSAQKIVTEALDAYLKTLPDLDAMADGYAAGGAIAGGTKRGIER